MRRDRLPAPEPKIPRACTSPELSSLVQAALSASRQTGSMMALLWIDLEHIKSVNEDFGHRAGDGVIEGLSLRMRARLRPDSVLVRTDGDAFLAIAQHVESESEALAIGSRILQALEQPCSFGSDEVTLTGSIGISVYPLHGTDAVTLLKNAHDALDSASLDGGAQARLYRAESHGLSVASRETSLKNALEKSEFRLLFQPQVDMQSGTISGAEVLLRWEHPTLGRIPAQHFIPVAERTGLIRPIGIWVLREACRCAEQWINRGPRFTLAVNVSAVQFSSPEFLQSVSGLLHETGFPAGCLELEITETVLLREPALAVVIDAVERMRGLGIRVALDDFGAGYSSLCHVRELPLDTLKIDRSFLAGAEPGSRSAILLGAMAAMGHSLGLRVVAEGIETEERFAVACEAGCDVGQGFLFGAPMNAGEITALLRKVPGH